MAEEAVRRIDYDFDRLKVDTLSSAIRARQFDLWTTEYLTDHPDAIVLHLGCGLDRRRGRHDVSVVWPGYAKLPLAMRALVRVFDFFPGLRKLSRLLLYRF